MCEHEEIVLSIVLDALDEPMPGVASPSPRQRYRHPRLSLRARPATALAADHIRIQPLYAGICGTDIHLIEQDPESGYVRTSAPAHIPPQGRVIGHEGVARVTAVGSDVTRLKPDDIVSFASVIACGACAICRKGAPNQCQNARLLGMETDGIFAESADIPERLALDVTSLVHDESNLMALACLEPAGVAMLACENAAVKPGESMLVFGGGPIGLLCALIGKQVFGAARVELVEPVATRRTHAAQHVDAVHTLEGFFAETGRRFDVVIEASGHMDNINRVFREIASNGRVILLARSGQPLHVEAVDHMITNAISVMGSRGHLGGALERVLEAYATGALALGSCITGRIEGLDALLAVLKAPETVGRDHCKLLVRRGR